MRNLSIYKICIAVLLAAVLLIVVINFLYKAVFDEHWDAQDAAIQRAYAETEMVSSTEAEPFFYEEAYMIVFGKDSEDKDMIVWVGEDEIHSEYAQDGVNKNLLRVKLLEKYPEAKIIRSTPGKYREEWVWEVHYQRENEGVKRTYYDYYRFSDGELLQSLAMSVEG